MYMFTNCEPVFANTFFLHHAQTPLSELFLQGLQSLVEAHHPKSTSQINDRLHTIVSKNSSSQISLPIYFGCFSLFFPIDFHPPSPFLLVIFVSPPRLDGGLRFGHRQLRKFLHKKATIMKPRIHGRLSALQMPGFLGQVFTMLLVLVRLMRRIWY